MNLTLNLSFIFFVILEDKTNLIYVFFISNRRQLWTEKQTERDTIIKLFILVICVFLHRNNLKKHPLYKVDISYMCCSLYRHCRVRFLTISFQYIPTLFIQWNSSNITSNSANWPMASEYYSSHFYKLLSIATLITEGNWPGQNLESRWYKCLIWCEFNTVGGLSLSGSSNV